MASLEPADPAEERRIRREVASRDPADEGVWIRLRSSWEKSKERTHLGREGESSGCLREEQSSDAELVDREEPGLRAAIPDDEDESAAQAAGKLGAPVGDPQREHTFRVGLGLAELGCELAQVVQAPGEQNDRCAGRHGAPGPRKSERAGLGAVRARLERATHLAVSRTHPCPEVAGNAAIHVARTSCWMHDRGGGAGYERKSATKSR